MNSSDIAKIAGVSRSTVSRVINNYSNVPEETRKKISEIIEQNKYVPHASARMLAGVKNIIIGLFIVEMNEDTYGKQISRSSYFAPFTNAAIDNASKLGYNVLVSIVSKPKDYKKVKELFYNKTISGGIFIGEGNCEPAIKEIINGGYKVVLIDQDIKADKEVYSKCIIVNADNYDGAYKATKYLINLGHSKIAHLTGIPSQLSSIQRIEGYKCALREAGISIENRLLVKGDFTINGGYQATKKLILKEKPTAIFSSNDSMVLGAYHAIAELGLKIPEDISVFGFDDIEASRYLNPALSTVKVTLLEMASIGVNSLITSIENNSNLPANYIVPVELIERESCAALKK
ncbi:LacI family DNA-binding transcriptional regulator [Clostridium sp.]